MYLVDVLHRRGVGVLLDWVPAHFAMDPQGLGFFDGSTLFEPNDALMRTHPDWGTYVFDYEKPGVRSFLLSNALFWLDRFHFDGLRVDAVASMVYRNYSRTHFTPNRHGGTDHLEAISLLQAVNTAVYEDFPEAMTVAEESTAFPGVTRPAGEGGLGFLYKWNMGWMHDTLEFAAKAPEYRPWHRHAFTFPLHYAFSERFVLPLSHDEVVHLKKPLLYKMPGDAWQQAANLRLLYGHMMGHPGKKLLFMGGEFGQTTEWNHDRELDWTRLGEPLHQGIARFVHDLLHLYKNHPALWDDTSGGFQWLVADDAEGGHGGLRARERRPVASSALCLQFPRAPRENVRLGALPERRYRVVLNSDDFALRRLRRGHLRRGGEPPRARTALARLARRHPAPARPARARRGLIGGSTLLAHDPVDALARGGGGGVGEGVVGGHDGEVRGGEGAHLVERVGLLDMVLAEAPRLGLDLEGGRVQARGRVVGGAAHVGEAVLLALVLEVGGVVNRVGGRGLVEEEQPARHERGVDGLEHAAHVVFVEEVVEAVVEQDRHVHLLVHVEVCGS